MLVFIICVLACMIPINEILHTNPTAHTHSHTTPPGCLFVLDLLYLFHAGFVIQWRSKRYTVMQGTSVCVLRLLHVLYV